MLTIVLQQVSSKFARENAGRTLDKPVALRFIAKHLSPPELEHLQSVCTNDAVYIWGAKRERSHQTWKMLQREALVFFRRGPTIYKRGVVIEATTNEALAEALWGCDEDGKTWANIFFFATITNMRRPAAQFNKSIGRSPNYNWQGLVVLPIKESQIARDFFARELNAP